MSNHKHYTYRVPWSEEDNEYVALCAEFPSLSHLKDSPEKALCNMMKLVKEVIEDMEKNGEKIPDPLAEQSYSGKFMVRLTPEQHRKLVIQAAEYKISLNRLIANRLSEETSDPLSWS